MSWGIFTGTPTSVEREDPTDWEGGCENEAGYGKRLDGSGGEALVFGVACRMTPRSGPSARSAASGMSDEAPQTPPGARSQWPQVERWEIAFLLVVLLAIGLSRLPTLDNKLLENGLGYRQTFTAFQTVGFYESGIDLLHPTVPIFGAPWEIPTEFPLFQAFASVPMSWGIPADVANRTTALGFFVLSGLVLWVLLRFLATRYVAAVGLVVFSFSPFALLWSRASLIEYLATFGALLWLLGIVLWRYEPRLRWIALGVTGGAVAALVKLPTAVAWVAPIVLHSTQMAIRRKPAWVAWIWQRFRLGFLAMTIIPAALGVAWTLHGDAIKRASPILHTLPERGKQFFLGTLDQRRDIGEWLVVLGRISTWIVGHGWAILAIGAVVVVARNRPIWIGLLLVPFTGIAIFFTPYTWFGYYLAAVTPALAAVLALGIASAASWIAKRGPKEALVLVVLTTLWFVSTAIPSYGYWSQAYDAPRGAPFEAIEIAQLTQPGDRVIVGGIPDDPRVLYYAQRKGLMIYQPYVTREIAQDLVDHDNYRALYLAGPLSHLAEWAAVRPWYAPVTANTLLLGSSLTDLGAVELAATTEPMAALLVGVESFGVVELEGTEIQCDGVDQVEIPGGSGTLWVAMRAIGEARPVMRSGIVPVPSESSTLVWQAPDGEADRPGDVMTCINEGSIVIEVAVVTGTN